MRSDGPPRPAWDLSGPIREGGWSYADLPALSRMARFRRETQTGVEADGFETERLVLDTHTGTYLETSAHLVSGGRRLDSLPAPALFFRAWLLRLPPLGPRGWVSAEELERFAPAFAPGDALLVDTGWGARWDDPGFVADAPAYLPECAGWLRDRAPGLLGVDVPCIDSPRPGEPRTSILADLFARDGVLLAPARLDRIPAGAPPGPFELAALPLAVQGACAAPCRAVLRGAG
jgi:arylformamidase